MIDKTAELERKLWEAEADRDFLRICIDDERSGCAQICQSLANKAGEMGRRHPEDDRIHGQAESMALTIKRQILERGAPGPKQVATADGGTRCVVCGHTKLPGHELTVSDNELSVVKEALERACESWREQGEDSHPTDAAIFFRDVSILEQLLMRLQRL